MLDDPAGDSEADAGAVAVTGIDADTTIGDGEEKVLAADGDVKSGIGRPGAVARGRLAHWGIGPQSISAAVSLMQARR